jgi:hypothetical protein
MDHRTLALWARVDTRGGLDLKDFLTSCRLQLILRKVFGLTLESRNVIVSKRTLSETLSLGLREVAGGLTDAAISSFAAPLRCQ